MPPDPRAEKLLQRVLKCLELNRLKILELDCQLQPQEVRKIDALPDAVLIKHNARVWEFDLNDPQVRDAFGPQAGGFPDQYDILDMLQENIELYLEIPVEQQVFYVERDQKEMRIDDLESFREAFFGWRKALLIVKQASDGDDLATTAVPSGPSKVSRLLQVRFRGQTHNWLDLDEHRELLLDRPDLVLRDNISAHFHIPCEFQEIRDSYGALHSAADFRRVLQSRSPVLELVDIRLSPRLSPPEANVLWNSNNSFGGSIRKVPAPVPVSPSPYFRTMPAQSPQAAIGPEAGSLFDALDHNHDGVISRKEWNQAFGSPNPYSYGSSPGSPGMGVVQQPTFGMHFDRVRAAAVYEPMIKQQPLGPAALGGRVEVVLRKETALDNFGFGGNFDQESRVLLITNILHDGLLARWNMMYPGSSLQIGDAILSVNGTANDAVAMMGLLQVARDAQLVAQKR